MTTWMEEKIHQPVRRPPSVFDTPVSRRPPSIFTDESIFSSLATQVSRTVDLVGIVPAAAHIGVPVEQLQQLVERRGIMHYCINATPMFDSADLDAWLDERPALKCGPRGRLVN